MNTKYERQILESLLDAAESKSNKKGWISSLFNVVVFMLLTIAVLMTINSEISITTGLMSACALSFLAGAIFIYKINHASSTLAAEYYDMDKMINRLNEIKHNK